MATPQTAASPTALVRHAGETDVPTLVDVLSAAFQDDPVFTWLFPDPARRAALNPPLFRLLVDSHLPLGEVYAAEVAPASAAVWVPPGLEPDEEGEAEILAAFVDGAEEYGDRLATILSMMAEVHPAEEHAYLFVLGTLPDRQSQGLGSALVRHVTERLDREGTPAYLEASSEGNRRLYLRHGFADRGILQLPDGPPLWRMWRDPR